MEDIEMAERCIRGWVNIELTQGEYDALVDFTFNVGCYALLSSTLLTLLNAGLYDLAAQQLDTWDKAGGKELSGLLRRRIAEAGEFDGVI